MTKPTVQARSEKIDVRVFECRHDSMQTLGSNAVTESFHTLHRAAHSKWRDWVSDPRGATGHQ